MKRYNNMNKNQHKQQKIKMHQKELQAHWCYPIHTWFKGIEDTIENFNRKF